MAVTMESKRDVIAIEVGDCTEIHDENRFYTVFEGPGENERTLTVRRPARVAKFTDTTIETMLNKARGEGQAEAWELAKKMVLPASYGGYSTHETEAIFGTCELVKAFDYCPSYADAQAKVIAYEEAFHVGDVVVNKYGSKAVITCVVGDGSFYIMYKDGSGSIQNKRTWWGDPSPIDLGWKKTGKTIDVSGITDELKE